MLKIHKGKYEILEWKGEEYYRFGTGNWMQLMGCSLEDVYDDLELENAYRALVAPVIVDYQPTHGSHSREPTG